VLRHVALFTWTSESSSDQRNAAVSALLAWRHEAREFGTVSVGVDAGLAPGNADAVVIVDLPDLARYRSYAVDERHQTLIREHIRPILAQRSAVQYEYEEGAPTAVAAATG